MVVRVIKLYNAKEIQITSRSAENPKYNLNIFIPMYNIYKLYKFSEHVEQI